MIFQNYINSICLSFLAYSILQIFLNFPKEDKPLLVWWNSFMPHRFRETDCYGGLQCIVTGERIPEQSENLAAYLFYGSHIESHDFPLPRNNKILWAVYHEESPKNYAPFLYKNIQDLFNITATFSRDSHFPLTLNYLENVKLLTGETKNVQEKNFYLNELAPVIYIQSDCDTPSNRDDFVKDLMQHIAVDSYGKCLTNRELPPNFRDIDTLDYYNKNLMELVSKYKFVIAFENAICYDYITEKLWRPLVVGSVPIYLGSPSVEDWLPNDNSAILVKNFNDAKELADHIEEINQNDFLYDQHLVHKIDGRIDNENLLAENLKWSNIFHTGHSITEFECFVCQKVYEKVHHQVKMRPNTNTVYDCPKPENSWDQFWDMGRCQAKALGVLMEKDRQVFKETFDALWRKLSRQRKCQMENDGKLTVCDYYYCGTLS